MIMFLFLKKTRVNSVGIRKIIFFFFLKFNREQFMGITFNKKKKKKRTRHKTI